MIAAFLNAHGIDLGIERVEHNPFGPDWWQRDFVHYALWVTDAETRQAVPLYFSYDRRYLEPGPHYFAEAANPTLEFTFSHMARVLHARTQGLDFFTTFNGLGGDPAGAEFYYHALERAEGELLRLLGPEAYEELRTLGARLMYTDRGAG